MFHHSAMTVGVEMAIRASMCEPLKRQGGGYDTVQMVSRIGHFRHLHESLKEM